MTESRARGDVNSVGSRTSSQRASRWRAAGVLAVCLVGLAAPALAFDELVAASDATRAVPRTMAANALVAAACPGPTMRTSDLALAKRLNDRAAFLIAMAEAVRAKEAREQVDPLDPSSYHFADDPETAARAVHRHYGPDSFVTRSAQAILAVASAAERGAQVPLDRINTVADAIVEAGRERLGWRSLPDIELRSRLWHDEATVRLSSSW